MSDRTLSAARVTMLTFWVCVSGCMLVLTLNVQAEPIQAPDSANNKDAVSKYNESNTIATEVQSAEWSYVKVTQRQVLSSLLRKSTIKQNYGQPSIERQTVEENNLAFCSSDLGSTWFIEPLECTFGGELFKLCPFGQRKAASCVLDKEEYCEYCTRGVTYMSESNNCLRCRLCTVCGPNQQVKVACDTDRDTQCEPASPSTEAPNYQSCPPCPVTQVITKGETNLPSTPDLTTSIAPIIETPGLTPTQCPERVCNCSEECRTVPDMFQTSACHERIILYVVIPVLLIVIIILLIIVVYLCTRKKLKARSNGNGAISQAQAVQPGSDNAIPQAMEAQLNSDGGIPQGEARPNGYDDISQADSLVLEEMNASNLPLMPAPNNASTDASHTTGAAVSDPQYKPVQSQNEPNSLIADDVAINQNEAVSRSLDYSGRFENPAFEHSMAPTTSPFKVLVGHMNPREEEEPPEKQPFLPSHPSKKDKHKKKKLSGFKRFIPDIGKRKANPDAKSNSSIETPVPQMSSGISGHQNVDPREGSTSGASTSSKNVEDPNAKGKTNHNKNPPADGSDSKDKDLHLNTKSLQETLSDQISPDVASLTNSKQHLPVDKPTVGHSPTSDFNAGLPNPLKLTQDAEETSASGNMSTSSNGVVLSNQVSPTGGSGPQVPVDSRTNDEQFSNGTKSLQNSNKHDIADGSDLERNLPLKGAFSQNMPSEDKTIASDDATQGVSKKIPQEKIDLDLVAGLLSHNDLQRFYRNLSLLPAQVDQYMHDCPSTTIHEQIVYVLQRWQKKEGTHATRKAIIKALKRSGNNQVADALKIAFSDV